MPNKTILRSLCAALVLFSGATPAKAQAADILIDIKASANAADRVISMLPAYVSRDGDVRAPTRGPNGFIALLQLPYVHDSNPTFAKTGLLPSARFDPTLNLGLIQNLGPLEFTAASAFDVDQYAVAPSANTETWLSEFRLAARLGSIVKPYISYQPSLTFASDFSSTKNQSVDYGAGIQLAVPALPTGFADIDLGYTRRISTTGDSYAVAVKPTLALVSGSWRFLLEPTVRMRWFDAKVGTKAHIDQEFIMPAVVEYRPAWLRLGPGMQGDLQLAASYSRNFSSIVADHGEQWTIGPVLEFGLSGGWAALDPLDW